MNPTIKARPVAELAVAMRAMDCELERLSTCCKPGARADHQYRNPELMAHMTAPERISKALTVSGDEEEETKTGMSAFEGSTNLP